MALRTRRLFAVLAVALLAPPAIVVAGDRFPDATPESQGMSAEALTELGATIEGYLDRGMIVGGELLVIKNRRTVFHGLYGDRNREAHEAWSDDTICNIRSMTKTITGAAAQILIDRGQLALDDKVSKYIPGFDNDSARDITVFELLTHRSGLPLSAITTDINQYPSLLEMASAAGQMELEAEPGSKFWYSDAGTDTLGAVVEVASGAPLNEFVTKEIIEPLGLRDTFYALDADDPRFGKIASLYVGTTNAWARFWTPDDGALYPFAWGSQSVYGTPEDYAAFLAMWMDDGVVSGKRILSHEAIGRTLTPVSPMSMLGSDSRFPTNFSGLEVWYGQMAVLHLPVEAPQSSDPVIIGHSGSDGTIAWAWPGRDLMILYYTQSRGGLTAIRLEEAINRLILHPDMLPVVEVVPDDIRPLLGTYMANFSTFENEPFEVKMTDGRLALDIPSQMVFQLLDPDENGRWAFAIAPNQISVTFERDDDGACNLIRLHQGPVVFDIPRKGTPLAIEQAKPVELDPVVVGRISGVYRDPESGDPIRVFLEDGALCIRRAETITLHLRPTEAPYTWSVREAPQVSLEFQLEGERVRSMVRVAGEDRLEIPRDESDTP
ncbi:MAG: beta-lactamase family protein [Phycisphaeraceae bacterium]|nr:beta-lactamase family protein [Phycisphaeraceae bacterium]